MDNGKETYLSRDEVFARIDIREFYQSALKNKFKGKKEQSSKCPFHDDHKPSFSVNLENGLWRCFAGCGGGDVFDFHMKLNRVDFPTALRELDAMWNTRSNTKIQRRVITYEYKNSNSETIYMKVRTEPGWNGESKTFCFSHIKDGEKIMRRGCAPVLYNLPNLAGQKQVFIVEGEGKVERLSEFGLTATCLDAGAGSPWMEDYLEAFKGAEQVIILPDNDEPGENYASKIADALYGTVPDIRVVRLPGLNEGEDIIDWLKVEGNHLKNLFENVKCTPPLGVDSSDVVNIVNIVNVDSECSDYIPEETTFPFSVLSEGFRKFAFNMGEALNIDPEVAASSTLTILSGIIGNSVRISPKDGYDVAPFIWLVVIAVSGYGKSPLFNKLMEPIKRQQGILYEKAKKAEAPGQKSGMEHLLTQDCTVEALSDVFESSPRGVIAHQDELAGFIRGLNQYKAGKGNDREQYLQLFNADGWKIDRKGRSKFITNTGMALIGGIQPKAISDLFSRQSIDNGLLPRFIFIHGSDIPPKFSRKGLAESLYWKELISYCYGIKLIIKDGSVVPERLIFDKDALDLYENFYNSYMSIAKQDERAGVFISKLVSHYTLKFAGILHLVKSYEDGEMGPVGLRLIDRETTEHSIELAKFFMEQANKTLKLFTGNKEGCNWKKSRLISCILRMGDRVKNGKVPLSLIVEDFNSELPENIKQSPRGIGQMLKEINLHTCKGSGNRTDVIWDPEVIRRLLPEITLTSLTTITPQPEALSRALKN